MWACLNLFYLPYDHVHWILASFVSLDLMNVVTFLQLLLDTFHFPYSRPFEIEFLDFLKSPVCAFRGIMVLDDIGLNEEMVIDCNNYFTRFINRQSNFKLQKPIRIIRLRVITTINSYMRLLNVSYSLLAKLL